LYSNLDPLSPCGSGSRGSLSECGSLRDWFGSSALPPFLFLVLHPPNIYIFNKTKNTQSGGCYSHDPLPPPF